VVGDVAWLVPQESEDVDYMGTYGTFLFLGLGNGAVFAALAMALVVTYRSSGVLNFATGAQSLYAAYTYTLLRQGQLLQPIPGLKATLSVGGPMGFWPALLITLAIQALLGAIMYLLIFRPLRNHRAVAKAVASLGLASLLTALVNYQVGTQQLLAGPIYPQTRYSVGGVGIPMDRVWFAVTIIAVALVLTAIFRLTPFGLATRAAAESEAGALVSGLSPDRIALFNWMISSIVAGLAGILIAPLVPLVPGSYTLFIVPALAAAVVGRFYALGPAVITGLVLGALESVAVYLNVRYSWFPAGAGEVLPLIVVLIMLVARGKTLPTRGTLATQTLGRAYRPHSLVLPLAIGVPAAVVALYLTNGGLRDALITTFITAVISLSLVVVTGYVGQISLAQLALAGAAAFALSTLANSWGIPFPIAPILAALFATVVGVVVGLPALRIRGLLVGVVTLTLAAGIEGVWFTNNSIDGGAGGLSVPVPTLFGLNLGIGSGDDFPRPAFGLVCLVVLVLVAVAVAKLRASRLGSAMLAVRADERSAAASGVNVARVKLTGFAIGAFIAGLGGSLLAYQSLNVSDGPFTAIGGLSLFTTVFLAGITSVSGGLLAGLIGSGGVLFFLLSNVFSVSNWYSVIVGAALIVTVIFNPEGVVGPVHAKLDERRQKAAAALAVAGLAVAGPDVSEPAVSGPARAAAAPAGFAGAVPAAANGATRPPAPGGSGAALLRVQGLTVRYGGVVAVDDLSFTVREGGITGLIGPNGAGKTTTMDAICGFAGCQGTVELSGRSLRGLVPHRRAALGLGRTFQGTGLYEDLTVEENVEVGQQVAKDRGRDQVTAILSALGVAALAGRRVSELSQGQRQLVAVAKALAGQPKLLLLDEPAAGLDSTESLWLAERLRGLRDTGVTILLIDHDMSLVLGLCDEIHVLDFGALIASGNPDAIRGNQRVAAAYLGATHAQAGPVQESPVQESPVQGRHAKETHVKETQA
jgi:ABC-type branched-subunit amino acid transport system ATPase component/ABC-type branched-subunit amino acid transport system permease subunit